MKIKHELKIDSEKEPFANCKLNRKEYGEILTQIVKNYADGFVLAINNKWGTGKTTFIKMWQQHLEKEEFQTIYFNAWENDFDNNPLVALLAELKKLTTNDKNGKTAYFKSLVKKAAVFTRNIAPALARGLFEKYVTDTKIITEAIENSAKATAEILEKEIEEYASKKETINEFRKELEDFIKKSNNEKPLIFIIDELDRCRPNYAVEVLEQIKHLFSVAGIVFVLSIDKEHLSASVRGFYGSDRIDGDEYLRRFIDLEYSMPEPSTRDFVNYLYGYYQFEEFFKNSQDERKDFLNTATLLLNKSNTSLRRQQRIFAFSRLVLCSFDRDQQLMGVVFILIFLKTVKNELFERIENKKLELQELSDCFYELISSVRKDHNDRELLYLFDTETKLLQLYKSHKYGSESYKLKEHIMSKLDLNLQENLKYNYFTNTGSSNLAEFLNKNSHHIYLNLKDLIEKINLTKPLKIDSK